MSHASRLVKGGVAATAGCALALTAFVLPAQAEISSPAIIQPTDGATQINLIGYNDFHGRITLVDDFAATVLQAQSPFGADNTLIISNGDQVGASVFESSIANDVPSMDALLELGTDHFSSGNHEFDKGFDNRGEGVEGTAGGAMGISDYLEPAGGMYVANVRDRATGERPFEPYATYEVGGYTVAVISGVTEKTPSAVSPDGIADIEFTDMVGEVNAVAEELSADDSIDLIVASYHDGGPASDVPLEQNLNNAVFAEIVNETHEDVDVIFNGDTHQTYAYDAPNGDTTRPVIQAGEYAGHIGQVVLTVEEDEAGELTVSADSSVIPVAQDASTDGLSEEELATYATITDIQSAALADAEVLGAQQVGVVNDDITRAQVWADGQPGGEDRAEESTLGSVVADSMMTWANANTALGADLSIMNSGGLREDIDGDGVLTYKDAQVVLPFVNNLAILEISGADLKDVLEQQWQVDANGNVPSRPYLQLGLSSNVNYTYTGSTADDPAATQGEHITSVYIDGEPIQDDQTYNVALPSFLAAGGDNFTSLANGEMTDTGFVDLDAFIEYVQSLEGTVLEPEQTRNGFNVSGYFGDDKSTPVVAQGESHTFTVSNVDLKSLDFVANTDVVATIDGEEVGTAELTGVTANGENNTAELTITIPATLAVGAYTLELTANPSGSTVQLPIEVAAGDDGTTEPFITTEKDTYTPAETTEGVAYAGANWNPGSGVEISVSTPDGEIEIETLEANEDGYIEGLLSYYTYDEATGETITENDPFPVGEYTIVATQGDVTASTTFTVAEEGTGTPAPTPGDGDGNGAPGAGDGTDEPGAGDGTDAGSQPDGSLAQTGADSNLLFGILAAAGAALALGGTLYLVRRQRGA